MASLPSSGEVTQTTTDTNVPNTTATSSIQDISLTDFEQLIYANALTKRPTEAQQAFNLMEVKLFLKHIKSTKTNCLKEI